VAERGGRWLHIVYPHLIVDARYDIPDKKSNILISVLFELLQEQT
jgi:hypothetical protein